MQAAPNVFSVQDYDGVKVDVFAAGAMLFMMLCGFPPFSAATRADSGFRRIVCQRDVNGLLRSYGKAELSDDVSVAAVCTLVVAVQPMQSSRGNEHVPNISKPRVLKRKFRKLLFLMFLFKTRATRYSLLNAEFGRGC